MSSATFFYGPLQKEQLNNVMIENYMTIYNGLIYIGTNEKIESFSELYISGQSFPPLITYNDSTILCYNNNESNQVHVSTDYNIYKDDLLIQSEIDSTNLLSTEIPVEYIDIMKEGATISVRYKNNNGEYSEYGKVSYISIEYLIDNKCKEVDKLHTEKLYTDICVMFPDGTSVIQFRDEIDRANISNVSQGALALVVIGKQDELLEFRTADNITHSLKASEMMQIAMMVLSIKQELKKVCQNHKDTLRSLTTIKDVVSYDITTGW